MLTPLFALAALQAPTQAPLVVPSGPLAEGVLEWRAEFGAPVPQAGDQFGRSLAIGGDRAVIAAWRADGNLGGAHVYTYADGALALEASLQPSDGFQGSMCGTSVHVNPLGDLAVLSALGDDTAGPSAGAAYVFRRVDGQWVEEAKLLAPDADAHDGFSSSVAVGDDRIVIGARGVDVEPFYFNAGALYVFEYDGAAWQSTAKLVLPSDQIDIGDGLGTSVVLDGDRIAAGLPAKDTEFGDNSGGVFVWEGVAGSWEFAARVLPSNPSQGLAFGRSLALDGELLLVGSNAPGATTMVGSAFLFRERAGQWLERSQFGAPVPQTFDFFAETVALEGGRALVSARLSDDQSATAVHVYTVDAAGPDWRQTLLFPFTGGHVGANDSVAIGQDFALVGEALHGGNLGVAPSHVDLFAVGAGLAPLSPR